MKKCQTEEERKQAKRDYMKQYYQKNKEKFAERMKQYYEANREKRLEQRKQYCKDNADKIAECNKQWREKNADYMKQWREKNPEYWEQWYGINREKRLEQNKQYKKTPMGRASRLVSSYNQADKKYNRGKCTLTTKWVVDHIFTSKCIYCGESDWKELGCDRIDNSKPHTEDNVVCCCEECNKKRGVKPFEEFLNLMTK